MSAPVWLAWLRVEPLPGCKVVPESFDPSLECALPARSAAEVPGALDRALARHRQRVAALEACVRFEERDWDDASDPEQRIRDAARAARESGEPRFVSFGRMPPPRGA